MRHANLFHRPWPGHDLVPIVGLKVPEPKMQLNDIERKKRMQSNEVKQFPLAEVQCRETNAPGQLTIVIIEDGQTQAAALQRVGQPPDASGVIFMTPQDALL
jgi:hypothetical protein